jgi:DNA-binding transcriptional LysR family regulator
VHSRPHGGEWCFRDRNQDTIEVQVSGRFAANNGDVLKALALKGEGIICVPSFIVDAELTTGRLVRLLTDYEVSETPVSAVYPHSRFLSAKVRAFVDVLTAHLNQTLGHSRKPFAAADAQLVTEPNGGVKMNGLRF